ncbi:hypothetical protein D307_gp052 [Bacillus phage Bastille]|uniref:DUF1146 domain-containing protein n=1 Tax=Bacillus phage Bastille TaxID=57477 RepID=J9PLE0_9CAUD|nr:hypothetical protein D307_gp052 [Bacillus phage Bastille]AEQ34412.1 hypothetical protein [Bacillus phage Bastille]AZF89113.1 membrane-bound protein [Bacillus phage vB_BthM-Goe5]
MILRTIFITIFLLSSYSFIKMALGEIKKEDVKKVFIYGMLAFVTGVTVAVDILSSLIADLIR